MNLARKARRAAQRQTPAQNKPFLQGDPPQADLARVLHTYRTRPHGEALALVTSLMTR